MLTEFPSRKNCIPNFFSRTLKRTNGQRDLPLPRRFSIKTFAELADDKLSKGVTGTGSRAATSGVEIHRQVTFVVHDFASEKRKGALKVDEHWVFGNPAFSFGAPIFLLPTPSHSS